VKVFLPKVCHIFLIRFIVQTRREIGLLAAPGLDSVSRRLWLSFTAA
jgi:hypothetical protein